MGALDKSTFCRKDLSGLERKQSGVRADNETYCSQAPAWCNSTFGANWSVDPDSCWVKVNNVAGPAGTYRYTCAMKDPATDADKMKCCTGTGDAKTCGYGDYCMNSDTCKSFMYSYCAVGDNIIKDKNCNLLYKNDAQTSRLCSDLKYFGKESVCKDFCQQQVSTKGAYMGACLTAADAFCAVPENKNDPRCACILYPKGEDWKKLSAKLPSGDSQKLYSDYQCWASPCVAGGTWSSTFNNPDKKCSGTVNICNQAIDLKDIKADAIGKIESTCSQKDDKSNTSPVVGNSSSPTNTGTTSPTQPPPETPWYKQTNYQIGLGVGVSFFCIIIALVLFLIMSK